MSSMQYSKFKKKTLSGFGYPKIDFIDPLKQFQNHKNILLTSIHLILPWILRWILENNDRAECQNVPVIFQYICKPIIHSFWLKNKNQLQNLPIHENNAKNHFNFFHLKKTLKKSYTKQTKFDTKFDKGDNKKEKQEKVIKK